MKNFAAIKRAFSQGYRVNSKGKVLGKTGKPLKPHLLNSGYLCVSLMIDSRRLAVTVHQVVWCFFNNANPIQLNHIDGNKLNNIPENLEACTQSYNNKHAYSIKLRVPNYGACSGRSILTDAKVIEMRKLRRKGYSQKHLAEVFGIAQNTVSYICAGRTWRHLL